MSQPGERPWWMCLSVVKGHNVWESRDILPQATTLSFAPTFQSGDATLPPPVLQVSHVGSTCMAANSGGGNLRNH